MVAMPADMPQTVPAGGVLNDTAAPVLLHVPPGVASANKVHDPAHTCVAPVIAAGSGLTVIVVVVEQPAPKE